jgi:hypothetical protein
MTAEEIAAVFASENVLQPGNAIPGEVQVAGLDFWNWNWSGALSTVKKRLWRCGVGVADQLAGSAFTGVTVAGIAGASAKVGGKIILRTALGGGAAGFVGQSIYGCIRNQF